MYYEYRLNALQLIFPEPVKTHTRYEKTWAIFKGKWENIGWQTSTPERLKDYKLLRVLSDEEFFLEIL